MFGGQHPSDEVTGLSAEGGHKTEIDDGKRSVQRRDARARTEVCLMEQKKMQRFKKR
jgi:hypothetical protein